MRALPEEAELRIRMGQKKKGKRSKGPVVLERGKQGTQEKTGIDATQIIESQTFETVGYCMFWIYSLSMY